MCKRANREGGALSPSRIIGLRGRPGPCCSGLYISMPTLQLKSAHMAAPPLKQERGHVTRAEAGEEERTKANNNNNHLGSADVRKALAKCGKMVSLRRNGLSGDLYQGKGEALDPLPLRSGCALHLVADTIKRPRPDDALLACNGRFPTHLEEDSCVDLDQKNARCKAIDVDNCRFLGQVANGEAIEEEVEDQVMESAACIRVSVEEKKAQALGDDGHNLFGQVQNAEAIEVAVEEDQMMESVAYNRASVEEKKAQASGEDGRKFFGQVQNGDVIEEAEEVQVIVPAACIRVAIEEKEAQDFGEDGHKLFGLVQNSEAIEEEEEEQEEDEVMEAATCSRISEEEKKAEAIGEDGRIFFGQVQTGEAIEEEKEEAEEEEDDDDQVMESVTCIRVSVEEKKAGSFGEDRQKFFGHGWNCKAIEEEEKDQVIEDVICNSISNKEKKAQAIREDGQKFCRQGQNGETMEEEDERMEVMAKHGKRDKDVDEEENRVLMTEKILEINRDEKKDTHDAETSKVVDEEENRVLMKEKMVEINKDEKKDTCHAETTDGLKEVTGTDLGESKDLLEEDLELARQNQSFKGVETETKRFTEQGGSNTEAVEKKKSRALEDERDADSSEEVEAIVLEAEIMKDQEYQSMDGMKSTMLEELKSGSVDTNGLKAGQKRKPLTDGPVKKAKKKPVNVWVKSSSRRKKKALKQIAEPEDCVALYPIDRNQGRLEDGPDVPILLSRINKSESIELSEDRLAAGSTKGYRMVRSTRGVVEGAWYFEIEVEKLGPTGHTRLGWSTSKGEIQGPVGYDSHSYAYRDVDGSKVHAAIREPYGEGYVEGDVIGFYINLPNGRNYAPKPPPIVCYRGQPWFLEAAEEPLKVVPGSEILLFRNGICQGIAFKDIYAGRYYPAASMYTLPNQPKCSIRFNFGPNFRFPPDEIGERPAPLPMFHAPFSSLDGSEVEARQSVEEIVMI